MLQITKSSSSARFVESHGTAMSPSDLITALVNLARRRFVILVLVFLLSLVCGAIYLYTTPSKFLARTSLIIDTRKSQVFQQQSVVGDSAIDSPAVDSQIEVLKSEGIATAVIKELRLTSDPEFVGSKPGVLGTLLGFVTQAPPTSEAELLERARGVFRAGLFPRRVATTYVIEIGFLSLSPDRAAQVANATADAYIVDQLEAKYQATRRASTWLQERIQELRQQASNAERAVLDFKKANGIVDTGGRLIGEQQLAELNSQIVSSRAATAEARARLNRIGEVTKNDVSDFDSVLRSPDPTITDALRNDVINKLRSEFLDAASKESVYSARLGRDHLIVVNLRSQMFEIRKSILDELRRIEETFKSDYQIALAREQSIQQSLSEAVSQNQSTNQSQIALKDLDSNAQTFRALHDNFVQRYMESIQQQSFPFTEARVISQAARPGARSQPNSALVMTLASASGLLIAFGIAILIDLSEGGFRTADQVERELHANCLSVVPMLKMEAKPIPQIPQPQSSQVKTDKVAVKQIEEGGVLFGVIGTPFSRFAEAFRTVKVGIDIMSLSRTTKVIGITSTNPNEGKTTVVANLARLISHAGGKAILLDCDLRNPSLTRALAPGAETGMLDVISGNATLADAIWTDPATSLAFVPMVAKTRISHTNEILASAAMKKIVDSLREVYDYVLLDLPPLTPVVDVRATSQLVDSYLFVIEWGMTKVDNVERALASAPTVHDNLLGVVLNKADLDVMRNYARSGSYSYKDKYYERYGFEE